MRLPSSAENRLTDGAVGCVLKTATNRNLFLAIEAALEASASKCRFGALIDDATLARSLVAGVSQPKVFLGH
jgi:hypothetical protein